MNHKFFVSIEAQLIIEEGKKINKRSAWLYVKNRKGIKIIQLGNNLYIHRFKGYYIPSNANEREMRAFFDFIAPIYNEICKQNIAIGRFLLKRFNDLSLTKEVEILDIMAGTGLPNTIIYQAGYIHQLLLDLSGGMLSQAKEVMPEIKTHVCLFKNFKPHGKFDIIFSILGLHYMFLSWQGFARKIKEILKKNGYLIIVESNVVPLLQGFKKITGGTFKWNNGDKIVNLHHYTFQNN